MANVYIKGRSPKATVGVDGVVDSGELSSYTAGVPGTPGQSQVHALVIYKDPFTVSVVNNAVDVIDYQVVSGTSATTGSQVAPDDAAIRSAIPSGSLKFVAVVGYVTIAYGASSVSLGNLLLLTLQNVTIYLWLLV